MIRFEVDNNAINQICKHLQDMPERSPAALKSTINATAKVARKALVEQAQKAYTVKTGKFNKAATIRNATTRNLTATVVVKGSPLELKDFKTSPAKAPKVSVPGSTTKAKVYSSNPLKPLEMNGIKAFVTQFANGHVSIAQRRTKKRLPIKVLFSTSLPKMIGSEKKVYGIVEPQIQKIFNTEVERVLNKMIERYRA